MWLFTSCFFYFGEEGQFVIMNGISHGLNPGESKIQASAVDIDQAGRPLGSWMLDDSPKRNINNTQQPLPVAGTVIEFITYRYTTTLG
jgi:hypothetical protein